MNINKNAKRILVYGDSYTFGKIPGGQRYDSEKRFTGILQKALGEGYEIIEEGLRGRTIEGENGFFPYRNGFTQFGPIFGSHLPVDLLILFLGTNDLNNSSKETPEEVAKSYEKYLERVEWWCNHLVFPKPKIMVVAPPQISERDSYKEFKEIFKGSESKIRKLINVLEKFARSNDLQFFDSSKVVGAPSIDGIHLSEESNKLLGESLAEEIIDTLSV